MIGLCAEWLLGTATGNIHSINLFAQAYTWGGQRGLKPPPISIFGAPRILDWNLERYKKDVNLNQVL